MMLFLLADTKMRRLFILSKYLAKYFSKKVKKHEKTRFFT